MTQQPPNLATTDLARDRTGLAASHWFALRRLRRNDYRRAGLALTTEAKPKVD
jgi:hypothetical protein